MVRNHPKHNKPKEKIISILYELNLNNKDRITSLFSKRRVTYNNNVYLYSSYIKIMWNMRTAKMLLIGILESVHLT
jgi:hypothetical protein